jgi:hypothetical protein
MRVYDSSKLRELFLFLRDRYSFANFNSTLLGPFVAVKTHK